MAGDSCLVSLKKAVVVEGHSNLLKNGGQRGSSWDHLGWGGPLSCLTPNLPRPKRENKVITRKNT